MIEVDFMDTSVHESSYFHWLSCGALDPSAEAGGQKVRCMWEGGRNHAVTQLDTDFNEEPFAGDGSHTKAASVPAGLG